MPSCPACGRSVALARATCLYCGAPLDGAAAHPAPVAAEPGAEPSPRVLVLVDLAAHAPEVLARALAVSAYEAGLLARRGGLQLVRAAGPEQAAREAAGLRERGASPLVVAEAEVLRPPLLCLAGAHGPDGLALRTTRGALALAGAELELVVSGPIAREYQATPERRRIATARLEEGFRLQLHRRGGEPPLEIDAFNFEVGFAPSGSVRLELEAWLAALAPDAPRDTGFSRLPPLLAPAAPEPGGALAAAGSLATAARRGSDAKGPVLLDNVAQFRFYSGCRAAALRRRSSG